MHTYLYYLVLSIVSVILPFRSDADSVIDNAKKSMQLKR